MRALYQQVVCQVQAQLLQGRCGPAGDAVSCSRGKGCPQIAARLTRMRRLGLATQAVRLSAVGASALMALPLLQQVDISGGASAPHHEPLLWGGAEPTPHLTPLDITGRQLDQVHPMQNTFL